MRRMDDGVRFLSLANFENTNVGVDEIVSLAKQRLTKAHRGRAHIIDVRNQGLMKLPPPIPIHRINGDFKRARSPDTVESPLHRRAGDFGGHAVRTVEFPVVDLVTETFEARDESAAGGFDREDLVARTV